MKRLFDALEAKHPGLKILDVRFTTGVRNAMEYYVNEDIEPIDLDELDKELAEAIRTAVQIPITELA